MGALQFQASQVIARLERAVERAADGGGTTWNNSSGFLTQPKKPDEILALIQVWWCGVYTRLRVYARKPLGRARDWIAADPITRRSLAAADSATATIITCHVGAVFCVRSLLMYGSRVLRYKATRI